MVCDTFDLETFVSKNLIASLFFKFFLKYLFLSLISMSLSTYIGTALLKLGFWERVPF